MKQCLIAVLLLLTVSACLPKKKSDVEPDLAGTYQVSQITSGSVTINLPDRNGSSATAVITRPGENQINVTVNVTENGSTSATNFGTLTTRKVSGKDYDVLNPTNSTRLGSINGTDFTLDFMSNGQRFALTARK